MDPELRERLPDAREREHRQRAKTRAALAEIELQGDLKTDRRHDQRTDDKFYHRLLDNDDLWACGIKFSRQHLFRLIKAGKFPRPIKMGGGGRNTWIADEIDARIAARISERDTAT
jgi:prophage regulatory protein